MTHFKNLIDFVAVFGPNAQETLNFISDETNQRKFKRYLAFQGTPGLDPDASDVLVQNDRTDKETKIRIAIDGGKFLTKDEWNAGQYSKDDVIGIAVITPCVQFILGLHQWKERWSEDTDHCITGKHSEAQALQVISGFEATKVLAETQEDEGNTAAKLCWSYDYKGLQWYCPCLLELNAVCANKEEINELLELVGGELLDFDECYWSSTEGSAGYSWYVSFSSGVSGNGLKFNAYVVRPAVAI